MEPEDPKEAERQYQQGKKEVEEIQAITEAGSEEREALYLQMEMDAFNRGEDY